MAEKKDKKGPNGGSVNPIKGSVNKIAGTTTDSKGNVRGGSLNQIAGTTTNAKGNVTVGSLNPIKGSVNPSQGEKKAAVDKALKGFFGGMDATTRANNAVSGAKPSAKAGAPAKQQKAASTAAVASPASTPNVGNNRIAQSPAFLAPLAAQVNKALGKKIQGVIPIKVTDSTGNTIIAIDKVALMDIILEELTTRDVTVSALFAGDIETNNLTVQDTIIINGDLVVDTLTVNETSDLGTATADSMDISGGLSADNATFNTTDAGTLTADSADISGGLTADNATFSTTSAGTLSASSADISGGLSCDNITIGGFAYAPATYNVCITGVSTPRVFIVRS